LAAQAYGALRDVKLARGLPRGGSETRPDKTQTSATIVAIAASTASERRTNFEAAIAITNSKIRAVQVMPLGSRHWHYSRFRECERKAPASTPIAALMLGPQVSLRRCRIAQISESLPPFWSPAKTNTPCVRSLPAPALR
jgi:hypothetical protein